MVRGPQWGQSSGHRVPQCRVRKGGCCLWGRTPPAVHLLPQNGKQVLPICLSRAGPSSRAWVSQPHGGQGGVWQGQSLQHWSATQQPGHTQDTWPAAGRGAGATLCRCRSDPTPWGKQRWIVMMALLLQRRGSPFSLGAPLQLQREARGPSCLVSTEVQLTSCWGHPLPDGAQSALVFPG